MPKKIYKIENFEGGLVNNYNKRDIPENALFNAVDVMVDIQGRVRMMGRDSNHALFSSISSEFQPGYGFFVFNTDYSYEDFIPIGQNAEKSKALLIQGENKFQLYDNKAYLDAIILGGSDGVETTEDVYPCFFYANGAVRVCDSGFETLSTDGITIEKNSENQWFGPVKKDMFTGHSFAETSINSGALQGKWISCDQQILPPDGGNAVENESPSNIAEATFTDIGAADQDVGINISVYSVNTTDSSGNEGDWELDSEPMFAYSWLYDGKPGSGFEQESKLYTFKAGTGTNDFDMAALKEDSLIRMQVVMKKSLFSPTDGSNDLINWFNDFSGFRNNSPRITGFRLYWSGDGVTGAFEDPFMLLEGYFGTSADDHAWIRSFENEIENITSDAGDDAAYEDSTFPNGLIERDFTFKTLPSLTYELINGYKHDVDSIYARYKTSCVVNGRLYAGNIYQGGRQYRDRMIKSPVFKYDILPSTNYLDVATDDGDVIIKLVPFADRILQFKRETLYIINVSGEFEYVEATHRFMGVTKPYAVTETEWGIIWVNRNGCYLYNGNEIENLIDARLKPNNPDALINNDINPDEIAGWSDFISETGMIGYIPDMKQLVVFEDPAASGVRGDVMIYDIRSKTWTRGIDRVSSKMKTNVMTNYDNTCMFGIEDGAAEVEKFHQVVHQDPEFGSSGGWIITGLNNILNFDGEILKLGSTQITGVLESSGSVNANLPDNIQAEYLAAAIRSHTQGALDAANMSTTVLITRHNYNMTLGSDAYSGDLNFYTSTNGSPTSTVTTPSFLTTSFPCMSVDTTCVIKPVYILYARGSGASARMHKAKIWCLILGHTNYGINGGFREWEEGNPLAAGEEFRYGNIESRDPTFHASHEAIKVTKGVTFRCKSASWTVTSKSVITADDTYVDLPLVLCDNGIDSIFGNEPGFIKQQGDNWTMGPVLDPEQPNYEFISGSNHTAFPLALPEGVNCESYVTLDSAGVGSPFNTVGYAIVEGEDVDPDVAASNEASLDAAYTAAYGEQGTFASKISITHISPSVTVRQIRSSSWGDELDTIQISGYTLLALNTPYAYEDFVMTNTEGTFWAGSTGLQLLSFDNANYSGGWTLDDNLDFATSQDLPYRRWTRTLSKEQLSTQQLDEFNDLTYNTSNGEHPNGNGILFWGASNGGLIIAAGDSQITMSTAAIPEAPEAKVISMVPDRKVQTDFSIATQNKFTSTILGNDAASYTRSFLASSTNSEFDIVADLFPKYKEVRESVEETGIIGPWTSEVLESYTITLKTFNNTSTITGDDTGASGYFLITNVDGVSTIDGTNIMDYIAGFKSPGNVAIRMSGGSTSFDVAKIYKVKGIKDSAGANGTGAQVDIVTDDKVAPTSIYTNSLENSGSNATITSVTLEVASIKFTGNNPHLVNGAFISGNGTTTGSMIIKQFKNDSLQVDDASNVSSYLRIETKDYTFGQPSVENILYKIEVTISFEGKLRIQYAANNTDSFYPMYYGTSNYITGSGEMTKYDMYFNEGNMPLKKSGGVDINSVRLKLLPASGDVIGKLNLNDISIIYRDKTVR